MTQIQGGRWDTILRRLFPVKGPVIAPALGAEIVPTVTIQPFLDEMFYLERTVTCVGWGTDAASAGNYSHMYLDNPAGSNKIAVVERLWVTGPGGAGQFYFGFCASPGTTNPGTKTRDLRARPGAYGPASDQTTCAVDALTQAGSMGVVSFMWETGGTASEELPIEPFILEPGSALFCRPSVQNTGVTVNFFWRERFIELSEQGED